MFTHQLCGTALFVGLTVVSVSARQTTPPPPRPVTEVPSQEKSSAQKANGATADAKFLTTAYQDGQAEIALADLATSKTQNADVKAFATKIKSDHEQADSELRTLAGKKNMTLTDMPAPGSTAEQKTMSRLQKLSGVDFDRAYASAMVSDHRQAVSEFTKASMSTDPDVKAFADKTLPVLKDHLQRAEDLQKHAGK